MSDWTGAIDLGSNPSPPPPPAKRGDRLYMKPADGEPYAVIVEDVRREGNGWTYTVTPAEMGQTMTSEDLIYRPDDAETAPQPEG